MAASVSIPAPSGVGTIRIRDRRRTRRAPRGAIRIDRGPAWHAAPAMPARAMSRVVPVSPAGWLTRDDARQFAASFAAFFTAAMIFLA